MTTVHLRRIDPAHDMRRFYRLDVQPDLFVGMMLVKAWGCIATEGRSLAPFYPDEAFAAEALRQQAERKWRRGYQSVAWRSARDAMSVMG